MLITTKTLEGGCMCNNILSNEKVSFKEIEQRIYELSCAAARQATVEILQAYDEYLAKNRDKKVFRDKGLRSTTIKTVYGEVEYSRHVYITRNADGKNETVYLLDKELGMDKIGLISTNLAEKIVMAAADAPFRKAAELVSETTGQCISHTGAWNLVQSIGEKLEDEERHLVEEFHAEQTKGKRETAILFEEMDGVWLKQQGAGGKKAPGMEVKVGTMYEGWKDAAGNRSSLSGKTVMAGIESAEEFHEKWEAKIESIYDPEKIGRRILNGDGGSWIKDEYDADVVKQLDRFHVVKMIRQNTSHDSMRKDMLVLLKDNKIDELLEQAQIYYDTLSTAEGDTPEEQAAGELLKYLENHREELANYKSRLTDQLEAPEGMKYRNMGVQENQNCTLITLRMKGKRKRWAAESANHMIRILYYRENQNLYDAVERYTDGEMWVEPVRNKLDAPLSAAKTAMVDAKGNNRYVDIVNVHLPVLDSSNSRTVKMFKRLIY